MKNKKGFTLVELLAVIVILAVILVIAVPQIMGVIDSARIGSLESTAKLIAKSAERYYNEKEMLGETLSTVSCSEVAKINEEDYESCSIEFIEKEAYVTIVGKGKFNNKSICGGTKEEANIIEYCSTSTYTISYNLNGGDATNIENYTVDTDAITLVNPTKFAHTFTGWTGSNGEIPQVSVTIPKGSRGNKTYTANYQPINYTITNLITNGSFENGTTGWKIYSSSVQTDNKHSGTSSLCNSTSSRWYGAKIQNEITAISPLDIVYMLAYVNIPTLNSDTNYYYMGISDEVGHDYQTMNVSQSTNGWVKMSSRKAMPVDSTPTIFFTNYFHKLNESTTVNTAYVDDIMIVNLTTTFGAGNEPSKEWCDNNFSYFDGTRSMTFE